MFWIFLTTIIGLGLWALTRKPKNFPPGPSRLPLVGSMPFISGKGKEPSFFQGLLELKKEYGKVCGFWMGRQRCIVISDFHLFQEVSKMDEVVGRPDQYPYNELRPGADLMETNGRAPGLILADVPMWREVRKVTSSKLGQYGFNRTSVEETLSNEVWKLVKKFQHEVNQDIELRSFINISVINTLWIMMVGESLELDDPKILSVRDTMEHYFQNAKTQSPIQLMLPHKAMTNMPGVKWLMGYFREGKLHQFLLTLLQSYIDDHQKNFDPNLKNDLLDEMLDHVHQTKDPQSYFYGAKGMASIFNIMLELFLAGIESTTTTIIWALLYLMHHPELQEEAHAELMKEVGPDHLPKLDDRKRLHLMNAIIHETMRLSAVSYCGLPRCANATFKVDSFVIPEETVVYFDLFSIMNDPEYFQDPDHFNPKRFLDQDGVFRPCERVVPFSLGKRNCMGQVLAEQELFLFLSGLLQVFKFKPAQGHKLPSIDMRSMCPKGIMLLPERVTVTLEKRS